MKNIKERIGEGPSQTASVYKSFQRFPFRLYQIPIHCQKGFHGSTPKAVIRGIARHFYRFDMIRTLSSEDCGISEEVIATKSLALLVFWL